MKGGSKNRGRGVEPFLLRLQECNNCGLENDRSSLKKGTQMNSAILIFRVGGCLNEAAGV